MARGAAIGVALCTLLALSVGVAVAQDPYGDVAELYYSPSEGPPGATITITGRCLYEGRRADRALVGMYDDARTRNVGHVSIPIDADGSVHGSFLVPSSEPPSQYLRSGYCLKDDFTIGPAINAPFRITDVTATTAPTTTRPPTTVATTITTTVPATTVPPTTAPTTTVASTGRVRGDGAGTALAALAAAGAVAGVAMLLVRRRNRRTSE